MFDRFRRFWRGPLRALLATILVAVLSACATSHMPTPMQCAVIGAGLGAVGGAAGGAEYANENSTAAGVGIGVAATVAGAALGWGLCRVLQPAAVSEPELQSGSELEPEPELEPDLPAEPPPEPVAQPETVLTPSLEAAPVPVPLPAPTDACAGTIELPGLHFALGQAVIRLDSFDILDRAIERLAMCPAEHVRVEGHSDSTGPDDLNQRLSRERAETVRTYLVDAGIEADRVTAVGFGGDRPIATNDTLNGRARNRRVEIRFVEAPQD